MMSRHSLVGASLVAVALISVSRDASAQSQTVTLPPSPAAVHVTNTVTIGGTFSVDVGSLVQNTLQANPCNPGACYDATTTVHANRGWQLQVTLSQTPANFTVAWIEKPQDAPHPLVAGIYQTIATGSSATPAQGVSAMYNANKTNGKGGAVPTASQLAAVLSYRVIASP
jgi:hypothetical protein